MKAIAIVMIIGLAVLALGAVARAASPGYGDYGYCGWRAAPAAAGQSQATHPVGNDAQPAAHRHDCGHWWGWLVPGHRAGCCTWNYGQRSGHQRSGSYCGGC